MKIFNRLLLGIFMGLMLGVPSGLSQLLVDVEFKGALSEFFIENQVDIDVENGVRMYKLVYETTDAKGLPETASGLVIVPDVEGRELPPLIFQHGTVGSREDVPSNLRGGYELALFFAAHGYFTCAADLIGLGESGGQHPYLHAASEASAAIDLMIAAREMAGDHDIPLSDQLFVTGYSQGGHAAMAAFQILERDYSAQFEVTAAAPMSGPYDLSNTMIGFVLGNEPYPFPSYLANIALGYQSVYGNLYQGDQIDQIFKPTFSEIIRRFQQEEITLWRLNDLIVNELEDELGLSLPKHMLHDSVLAAVLANPAHPINAALRDNDLYNWVPSAPTRIIYCMRDDQVSFLNSVRADSAMNALGAISVESVDVSPQSDHGQCIFPAIHEAIDFFDSFLDMSTAVNEKIEEAAIHIYPNPANSYIDITFDADLDRVRTNYKIYSINGSLIGDWEVLNTGRLQTLDVSHLTEGTYLLSLKDLRVKKMKKFVILR